MTYTVSVIIPVYNQEELITRALDSIPDVHEIIVIDDGSTDNTYRVITEWMNHNPHGSTVLTIRNLENRGVGYTVNKGLDLAMGDYIALLGSDDYFLPAIKDVIAQLDGTDLVYFNLATNNGEIFELNPDTKETYPGSVKFIRREFLGDLRCPEVRAGEDKVLFDKLLAKNPTEKFTGIVAKHYNFPRAGSLTDEYLNKDNSND